jgi:hypothetical protein
VRRVAHFLRSKAGVVWTLVVATSIGGYIVSGGHLQGRSPPCYGEALRGQGQSGTTGY